MRKLVLVVALVSAVGLGCGRLNEDLCALGGAFADDPTAPVGIVELALPGHSQAAPKAVTPVIAVLLATPQIMPVAVLHAALPSHPLLLSSRPGPIRC